MSRRGVATGLWVVASIVGLQLTPIAGCRRATPSAATQADASALAAKSGAAEPVDAAKAEPCRIDGSRRPLLVRWTAEQRSALETAMGSGIAVFAADDCHGLRLLPGCTARGHYGYLGVSVRTSGMDLSTEDELRVNAPAAVEGASTGAAPPRYVGLTTVGERATTRATLAPEELHGDCAAATHYVTEAEIGLATVSRSKDAGARSAAAACRAARPGDEAPPAGCRTILAATIVPIAKLGELVGYDRAPSGAVLPIGMCPSGMVVSQSRCVRSPTDAPYLCAFGDAAECRAQCDRGDMNSCDVLGFMLWHGKGVTPDLAQAAALYRKTCDTDDSIGCSNLAVFLYRGDGVDVDQVKAAALFEHGCALGDKGSCNNLGEAYLSGKGVAADPARGNALEKKACDAGLAFACENIAKSLLDADAGANPARGREMLQELCDGNNGDACAALGRMAFLGQGVAADPPGAAALFKRGCLAGDDSACVMLGLMYRQAEGVPRDDVLATQLMDRACTDGWADGCLNLGIAYENGKGVASDKVRAARLYEEACKQKVATACLYFADLLLQGEGVQRDPARAHGFYARACELGEKKACGR
jgi:TPR repeat protein